MDHMAILPQFTIVPHIEKMSEKLCSYEDAVDLPTDLTFVIKEENGMTKKLQTHKYHLSKASPVFRALIYNKWQSDRKETDEIVIENTNFDSFKTIIDYVYTNNMAFENMSIENVKEIEKLSDWYYLPEITNQINPSSSSLSNAHKGLTNYNFLKLTPTDVQFEVKVETENDKDENAEDNIIKGHKYHLASFSPVFKAMFFGTLKKDKVSVEGTSIEAFKFLIDWIYGNSSKMSSLSTHDQFQVYNLGELYDVPALKIIAETLILETKLSRANALGVAFEAENWSQFRELSETLWQKSVTFLSKEVLCTKRDIIEFSSTHSSSALASTAFRIVAELPDCQNCFTKPCLRGKRVQRGEARVGIKVRDENKFILGSVISTRVTSMGTEIIVETEEEKEKVTFMETDQIFRHNISFNGEKSKKLSHSGLSVKVGLYWNCD